MNTSQYRKIVISAALVLSAGCSVFFTPKVRPLPTPTATPAPAIAIFTFEVVGPDVAFVKVGDREWVTRPDRTIVEEARAGDVLMVSARADGYVPSTPVPVTMTAGRMAPIRIVLERVPVTAVVKWPALCASYGASFTDRRVDTKVLAEFLKAVGATCTRTSLLDAWAVGGRDGSGRLLPGQHDGRVPMIKLPNGKYDLAQWNEAFFPELRAYVDTMNREGVFVHLTLLELYTWSDRKAGLFGVPDPNLGPYRNNVNGVRWGNPDDPTFFALPDRFLTSLICKVVVTLNGAVWVPQIGNEMPEKELHERMVDALRACGWTGPITVNRNEDTPGQYFNMQIDKGRYDRIEFHGKLDMSYLDEDFPDEGPAGRPRTFRAMWPLVDPARIIINSDGGGGNPIHLPTLKEVACDALRRGASYDHQLAIKRNPFWGDGTVRMSDLEIDRPFLLSLKACR